MFVISGEKRRANRERAVLSSQASSNLAGVLHLIPQKKATSLASTSTTTGKSHTGAM